MSEKNINSRIVHKHDIESNWNKATGFIPKKGELIVYDADSTHSYERLKVGDGVTVISQLPFVSSTNDYTTAEKNKLAGIDTQISNAITAESAYFDTSAESTGGTAAPLDADTLGGVLPSGYVTQSELNASKIEVSENYLLKTATAADSSKLGGKAPEYYLQPRNLLDNSDFRNPVNQRGATRYEAVSSVYNIDRWLGWAETSDITPHAVVQDGYITVETGGKLQQKLASYKRDIVYTAAAKRTDGTVLIVSGIFSSEETGYDIFLKIGSDGLANVGLRSGDYLWAALYEGTYTADTLPPYVPKGYAAELAECQRYCLAIDYGSENFIAGFASTTNTTTVNTYFQLPVPMRTTPSLSSTDGSTWVIDIDGTRYVPTEVAIWFMSVNATLGMKFTCSSGLTSRKTGVVSYNSATKLILSCDL